jgi:peptide/nickel transport system substrate-binding protein
MKHPLGTGPWEFVSYEAANYIEFKAVEDHWRQTPYFETLTIKSVPELSARLAMLETGQANIGLIPPDRAGEMEDAGFHIREIGGASVLKIELGGTVLPTRENYDPTCPWVYHQDEAWDSEWNVRAYKVRKALALAIDKQAIVDNMLYGAASETPVPDWPLDTNWARADEWLPFPYDPATAEALLEEADYADGFSQPITMYAISGGGNALAPQVSEAVAMDWEAIGLDVDIVPVDWPVVRAKTSDRDTAWCTYVTGWGVTAEPWLSVFYGSYTLSGFVEGFESLELDALLDNCFAIMDTEERRLASLEVGDYLYEHIVGIGIAVGTNFVAMGPDTGEWRLRYEPSNNLLDYENIQHAD